MNITLPEGYEMRPDLQEKLMSLAAAYNLDEEAIQHFVDLHVELMEEYAAKLEQADHKAAIGDGAE